MPIPTEGWEIRLQCDAGEAPRVTTVRLVAGYSSSSRGPCAVAQATNRAGELVSDTVTRPYPPDCVALPEAPLSAGLWVGLVLLAVYGRRARG